MSMLDILKKLDNIEKKNLKESVVTECPGDMPSTTAGPVSVNITAGDASQMAAILKALSGIESSGPKMAMTAMPMDNPMIPGQDDVAGDSDTKDGIIGTAAGGALGALAGGPVGAAIGSVAGDKLTGEEWDNEPDEEYRDHNFMTKDLSGGINRQKKMYPPAAKGDNPMAVESIKDRLIRALNEKKAKPDYLDMDKDGNKKEPMKKAVADKKKVDEVSSKTRQSYNKAANASLDKALASGDKKTVKKRDRGLDLSYDQNIRDMKKSREARSKTDEAAKPDFLDMDKDGNKKEPMKKAVADKKKTPFKK